MSALPEKFTLHVESKGDGWWTVTCPEVPGLFLARPDLRLILADVPASVEALRRLNGESA